MFCILVVDGTNDIPHIKLEIKKEKKCVLEWTLGYVMLS
jgi:hypothetical protein